MKIKAIWEFDADVSDILPEHVDVEGFAIDLAREELAWLLLRQELTHEGFHFEVTKEDTDDHS